MGFKVAYDATGHKTEHIKPMYIGTDVAVKKGAVVENAVVTGIKLTAGTNAYGLALEAHDGATTGRQSGTEIKVSASPTAVLEISTKEVLTATGGSTTTFTDANVVPETDDIYIGAMLEVVTCAANANIIGQLIPVTDFAGATGVFTIPAITGGFAAGDTVRLHPGRRAIGMQAGLNATCDDVTYETAGTTLTLYDADPARKMAMFKITAHQV